MNQPISDENSSLKDLVGGHYLADYNILNDTETAYPNISLSELLSKQSASTPNKIALEFHDSKITYLELHKKANQLAHHLKAQGVQPGDYIAISISRSPELLYSLLAIMQCGAAYLPLDPEYPADRLEFMLTDSGAKVLLTCKSNTISLASCSHTLFIEDAMNSLDQYTTVPLAFTFNSDTVVYILYTSGSTGKPKGVPITHKNLVNLLYTMSDEPGINENDRLLSITSISFDVAGVDLFLPLIKGATLILPDNETVKDGRLILDLLVKKNITFLQATPASWIMFLDSGWSHPLPIKALCAGEAMPLKLAKDLLIKCDTVWNMYGPTETTIYSSRKQIKADDTLITIGKPIANTQFYIIDEHGQLIASGNIGEIAIGGDGVGKGYWNRAELTAEKFIKNPFSTGKDAILYRTGDLGRLLPTYEIECLGRLDQQVKIRGQRIEPGEVEQALLKLEGIKHAVVLANGNFLIAHIVPNSSLESAENKIPLWRKTLASQLPAILVPHSFILIDKIPTTLNGKIDRKTLSEYKAKTNTKLNVTAPRSETEKLVAAIWKECLDVEQLDIFSNFFEIGGHSLIAVKVMIRIEEKTGKRLPLASLFEYSTIEKLALLLDDDKKNISWDSLVPIKPNGTKTPLYIVHGAGLNVLIFNALAEHLDEDQPVFALQAKGLNGIDEPLESIEDIATYYIDSIMKTNPHGPYALAGYSFGGLIAYEMAHQFTMRGKKVTMVGLLDTSITPESYYSNPIRKKIEKFKRIFNNSIYVLRKMLTDWEQAKERINTRKKVFINTFLEIKNGKENEYEKHHQKQFKLDKMNSIAGKKYLVVPRPYKLDLFRVDDKNYYRHDRATLGWKKVALNGVEVHDIDGNHFELFAPPNDKLSARIIQEVLDQRNAEF